MDTIATDQNPGEAEPTPAPGSNVTSETALLLHSRMTVLESEKAEAAAGVRACSRAIKTLKGEVEAAGIDLKGFMRAREDAELAGSERERMIAEHQRQLAWLKKPIGFEPTLTLAEPITFTPTELELIGQKGHGAGKSNRNRDANPENVGTEAYVAWDNGWMKAQKELAAEMGEAPASEKKRRPTVAGSGRA
jgi:hypothetical protein